MQYDEELERYVVNTTKIEVVGEVDPHWRKVIGWAIELGMKRPEDESPLIHIQDTTGTQTPEEKNRAGQQRLQEYIQIRCKEIRRSVPGLPLLFPEEIGWQKGPLVKKGPFTPTRFRDDYNQYWKVWYKGIMDRKLMLAMIQHWKGAHKDFPQANPQWKWFVQAIGGGDSYDPRRYTMNDLSLFLSLRDLWAAGNLGIFPKLPIIQGTTARDTESRNQIIYRYKVNFDEIPSGWQFM